MKENLIKNRIAIIGGGAAGMTAGIFAKKTAPDISVTIFEEKDSLGKKINATGNGKCNFSNTLMSDNCYRSENPTFVSPILKKFDVENTIRFFNEIGISVKNKNGYLYPNSEEASSVSNALILTLKAFGVNLIHEKAIDIKKENNVFKIKTPENTYTFDKVIISCGSYASKKNPNEFNGYDIVKSLGHKVTSLFPSLCQIRCSDKFFKTINGVRTEGIIKIFDAKKEIARDKGELLFTDYGISGIPAFQVSRYCVPKSTDLSAEIDFLPETGVDKVKEVLLKRRDLKSRTAEEAMYGLLNHKLNFVLLNCSGISPTEDVKKAFTDDNIKRLSENIKYFKCHVTGTNGTEFAQVIAGGADTRFIDNETLESKIIPGLYFAGEILDVDGICGGYNLQWAWSTGYVAGTSAAR